MDKNIIIDGVNVAGCEFYQIEANELYPKAQYCGSMRNTFCENEPNCYYKQLQRLEQENFALTQESQQKSQTICELEKENKELKEENKTLNYQWHKQSEIGDEWYKVADKYKTALEEIKNVLKEICKEECDYTKPKFCGDCDCRYGQIYNKINEVLG